MKRVLASAIAYRHRALREHSFNTQKRSPPGSLVSYFDSLNQRYIYNLVTETRFFHKSRYESLHMSLMALRQHLERYNIRDSEAVLIAYIGQLFFQFYIVFFQSLRLITITIVQPPRY